ncbi:MAG TPA: nucleotidyltransferase domain-containing protein [Stellaceae bacterium]|nr:nucleotidyltransferase domain-containing protein [Stellaceae bacterium]
MAAAILDDPIVRRIRAGLDALYGDRIERVVLFGSRARGDAREDSDYDVAVFLRDMTDRWCERYRLADLRHQFLGEARIFLDLKPFPSGSYQARTSLMHEIREDGVEL